MISDTYEIETLNGKTKICPVYCEITGVHLCWRTIIPEDVLREWPDMTPAYISFEVFNQFGMLVGDLSEIDTF